MRLISFSTTVPQFRDRTKTVTRRVGWLDVKVGELLCAVVKAQGLKKGEHPERLGVIRVTKVTRVRLDSITYGDTAREGFPRMSPNDFIKMFIGVHSGKVSRSDFVARIEFEYVTSPLEDSP